MRGRALRGVLLAGMAAQWACLLFTIYKFCAEMFGDFPRLDLEPEVLPLLGAAAVYGLAAFSGWLGTPALYESLAAGALANIAALGLGHYAVGLAAGRLWGPLTPILLAAELALAAAAARWRHSPPRLHPLPAGERETGRNWSAWDAASAVILLTLLVPALYPYFRWDAQFVWACRAFALERTPSFAALLNCAQPFKLYPHAVGPTYPPLWSVLLWLGVRDPVFQGRLVGPLLLAFFALFFRRRLARISTRLAAPGLFFLLATGRVWEGTANYYADVPLMIFLTAGSLLALGLPRGDGREGVPARDLWAGTICLGAATLIRPDGLYYLAVVAAAALWSNWSRRSRFSLGPFAAAAAVGLSWAYGRPAILGTASYFLSPTGLWREAGGTAAGALWNISKTLAYGLQGQWLSHHDLGSAFYLLGLLWALHRWRRLPSSLDVYFSGLVSCAFLLAVAFCFASMPFLGNPLLSSQPGTPYLEAFLFSMRTSAGRMTAHLYPFLVLWGAGLARDLLEMPEPSPDFL